jgi:uncharacterized membrane protein
MQYQHQNDIKNFNAFPSAMKAKYIVFIVIMLFNSCLLFNKKKNNNTQYFEGGYKIQESYLDSTLEDSASILKGTIFSSRFNEYLPYGVVYVYYRNGDFLKYYEIDSIGNFEIKLKPNTYKVEFRRAGHYELIIEEIHLKERQITELYISLGTSVTR